MNLDGPILQVEFAELVGVSEAAVSQWLAEGVIERGATGRAWIQAYCSRLREEAAGRSGELSRASAELKIAQRQEVELRLAIKRREFAPVGLLEIVVGHVARQIATRLDALVPQLKRRMPDLPPAAIAAIEAELATCRELCADANLAEADRLEREEEAAGEDA